MSRSGYDNDECNGWDLICWRGQVASAIRGKRGQAFLRELVEALDALPAKRLIAHDMINYGAVCALGSVGKKRGIDLRSLNSTYNEHLAEVFGIAHQLVREIEYMNDETYHYVTPEARWKHMRDWALRNIKDKP